MKPRICITGATGGLGKALAVDCASRGWDLYITDLHKDNLVELAQGLHRGYGVEVDTFACDLTSSDDRARLFADMASREYRFKGLCNVAGLDYEGCFSDCSRDQIATIIRLNIEGTLDITHRVLELRRSDHQFLLITVSSLASFYPMPVKATYAASKRFLLNWSLALREELREEGVNVLALCPSGLLTNQEVVKSILSQGFMGRITTCNIGMVAARTIDRALKGRAIYIPGLFNRVLRNFGALVPNKMLAYLIGRRWHTTRSRINE